MEFMSSLQRGVDDLKPSLFELLSEQQLAALLPPTLRYLLALATHRNPRYLIRILNSFDEYYAILSLVVERYFLRTYAGGFTENFYGLKRARVLRTKGGEIPRSQLGAPSIVRETLQLRDRDVWANLAVMVGLPYLKRKLDEGFEIHVPQVAALGPAFNRDTWPVEATLRQRILHCYKWFLRKIYPSINAAYYFSLLVFNLAYLFDNTKYHSPWLWLIGTRIRRMGQADHDAVEAAAAATNLTAQESGRPGQGFSILNPLTLRHIVYPRLLSSFRFLLPTSIFALKFLEWWHASDFARQLSRKATEGLELPPPIICDPSAANRKSREKIKSSSQSTSQNAASKKHSPPISSISHLPILTVPAPDRDNSSLCPICIQPITTATASPYGYVYCYVCIHKWVEGGHERQEVFMEGGTEEENVWGDEITGTEEKNTSIKASREGHWESGKGRCAVTGKRVLGGTEGLRRVVV